MPPSTPFQSPRLYNVIVVLLSTPFVLFTGIICGPLWGSFAVLGSFAVQFGDQLRSGIICGLGIICGAVQTRTLGAGQFTEFILTRERKEKWNENDVNCGNTIFPRFTSFSFYINFYSLKSERKVASAKLVLLLISICPWLKYIFKFAT